MKKRWFSQTINTDIETGEILSKSRIEREGWVRKETADTIIEDCGSYMLKKNYVHWEENKQLKLKL